MYVTVLIVSILELKARSWVVIWISRFVFFIIFFPFLFRTMLLGCCENLWIEMDILPFSKWNTKLSGFLQKPQRNFACRGCCYYSLIGIRKKELCLILGMNQNFMCTWSCFYGMFFSVNFNESTGSSGISAENVILVFKSVSSVDILKKFSYDSSLWWVECLDWESTLIFGERGLRFGLWIVDCMFNMSIYQVWIYYRVSEDYGLTIDLVEDVLDNYYWAH